VVEFKYLPRPRKGPQTGPLYLDGLLSDTYRVAILASGAQVQLGLQLLASDAGFLGYLRRMPAGLAQYRGSEPTPRSLILTSSVTNKLPDRARRGIRSYENSWRIESNRTMEVEVAGKGLWLAAYAVRGERTDHGRTS